MMTIVGEYSLGPRTQAAEFSIHALRARATTVARGGCMQTLHSGHPLGRTNGQAKTEDTWYGTLGHFDAKLDTAPGAFEERWYRRRFIRFSDSDGGLSVRYLNWNGEQWNRNYNWLGNDWDEHNPSASLATLFISPLRLWSGRSFVY